MSDDLPRPFRFGLQDRIPRVLFWLLGVLAVPGLYLLGRSEADTLRKMCAEGVVAEATVRGSAVRSRSRGPSRWNVRLELVVGSQSYELAHTHVGKRPMPGDRVTVTYLPEAPEEARIGRVSSDMADSMVRVSTIVGAVIAVFSASVGVGVHFWRRRALRLLRYAPLVTGRIEGHRKRFLTSNLAVAFDTPDGARNVIAVQVPSGIAKNLAVGDPVDVLVDPKAPECSELRVSLEKRAMGRLVTRAGATESSIATT